MRRIVMNPPSSFSSPSWTPINRERTTVTPAFRPGDLATSPLAPLGSRRARQDIMPETKKWKIHSDTWSTCSRIPGPDMGVSSAEKVPPPAQEAELTPMQHARTFRRYLPLRAHSSIAAPQAHLQEAREKLWKDVPEPSTTPGDKTVEFDRYEIREVKRGLLQQTKTTKLKIARSKLQRFVVVKNARAVILEGRSNPDMD